ncbi:MULTISPECIES: DNA primase [unclassified Marinobacter]|uniref:DNA primase n=1 Tax=unclassified Marinobacter TaxID=83889 RepID=UPI0026E44907|nr:MULTISPECIES: DNA primase [unclassified Marinobacter]MDO6444075.1 DNA primase [Marinobacter sp. 2_MG-2023]MDO6824014.1 DNA primase [Marinobacter sp. 1_MG-2023]
MSGLIPQRFVEDLLDRVDLAELIGSRITLKKAGANYKACCPFHDEKTPSFNVRPDKGFYHCFGCGAHGDAISFVREFEGLGFTEAVEELARRAGLEVPYDQAAKQEIQQARTLTDALDFASRFYQSSLHSQQGAFARDYLKQRGLDESIIQQYQVGFAPAAGTSLFDAASKDLQGPLIETGTVSDKYGRPRDLFRNRIMFPIRNSRGKTIAFGGRTLGDDKAKYINSPESDVFHKSRQIYGLFEAKQALKQLDKLLVVEGYMDVIALAQHGIHYAVATLGTATNQDSLTALLKQVRHVVFCFDGDQAGFRAADRAMDNALELMADGLHLQFLMLPEGEDPDTLVRKEGAEAFQKRIDGATPLSRYLFDRQSEGLDLQLPENRGELRARTEPLLNKMPRSTLRDAMWHEMLRLCGGRNQWQNRPPQQWGKGKGERRDRITEERIDVKLSKDSILCLALLEAPDMASEITELALHSRQYNQARNFAGFILEHEIRNRKALITTLALNSQARERFYHLFDGIEHIPARESTLAAAREMLSPNEEASRQQKLATLLRNFANLTAEERQELRELSGGSPD